MRGGSEEVENEPDPAGMEGTAEKDRVDLSMVDLGKLRRSSMPRWMIIGGMRALLWMVLHPRMGRSLLLLLLLLLLRVCMLLQLLMRIST